MQLDVHLVRLVVHLLICQIPVTATAAGYSSVSIGNSTDDGPTIHLITVGKGSNSFVPNNVVAAVGDVISFSFYPLNHSVVKAQYGYPCVPYEDLGPNREGWFSGFHPVPVVTANVSFSETYGAISPCLINYVQLPSFNVTINDTEPLFYYCSAPGSCIDYGMVGAVNAVS